MHPPYPPPLDPSLDVYRVKRNGPSIAYHMKESIENAEMESSIA